MSYRKTEVRFTSSKPGALTPQVAMGGDTTAFVQGDKQWVRNMDLGGGRTVEARHSHVAAAELMAVGKALGFDSIHIEVDGEFPSWRPGWPTTPGKWFVSCQAGNVAMTIGEYHSDEIGECLIASGESDSVCFIPDDTSGLDYIWGRKRPIFCFGPIPECN